MRKAHYKKLLMLVAVMLAFACIAAACSPAAASSVKPTESKTESTTESKTESTVVKGDPVVVKYINRGTKPDTGDYDAAWKAINEKLLEELNCTLDVECLGSGDASQMALKYAGNEKFDMAFTASWWGYADNAQNNAFREITTDDMKTYMPYIYENLPDIAWQQAKVNGKVYMIPNMLWEYSDPVILYRGDLLEKYGMSELKTIEDLETYIAKVAENESGIIPVFGGFRLEVWLMRPNSWRACGTLYYDYEDAENPSAFHVVMTDEYMEFAKKRQELYKKGAWPADVMNDTTNPNDKFKNGLSAVTAHNLLAANSELALPLQETHPEWDVKIFDPYLGKKVVLNSFTGNGWALTRGTEHAAEAMQIVNYFNESEEMQKLLRYGFEGINYEMQDGKLVTLSDVPEDKKHNIGCNSNMGNSLIINSLVKQDTYEGYAEIKEAFEKNTVEHPLQAFTFDNSEVQNEVAQMTAVSKEYAALEYGLFEDVEKTVEAYRAALKAAGYEKVQAEYDRQIKEFMQNYNK